MDNTISIVHNGIIENYAQLKADLQSQGIAVQIADRHRGHSSSD